MRICGLDLETTGLNFETDKIIELAYVITEHDSTRPLVVEQQYVCNAFTAGMVPNEITDITGITDAQVDEMGLCLDSVLSRLDARLASLGVKYIVAHNGENFDRPFLLKKIEQELNVTPECYPTLRSLPWLDTRADIEFPPRWKSHSLMHVAAELGFLNPFPHMAVSDVMTTLRVLRAFDFERIIARAKEPWVTVRAMVKYESRDKAKARRYAWEVAGDKRYDKCWVKRLKACDIERERLEAGFEIVILEGQLP